MIPTITKGVNADTQADLLRFTSVAFAIVLFFVSAPLWTQSGELYPQIPLFEFARTASAAWDRVALVVMLVSLAAILAPNRRWQFCGCCGFVLSSIALVVLDQHRLQPWLQQLMLLCVFSTLLPRTLLLKFARWLLISIYLFSAASKIDYVFLQSLGHQFSDQAFSLVGADFKGFPEPLRWCCAWSFPIGELLIGIGLIVAQTRRIAAWLAIALHIVLLLILGPLGLNHEAGVLFWNLFFVAQLVILFLLHKRPPKGTDTGGTDTGAQVAFFTLTKPDHRARIAICSVLLTLPVLEPFGFYDHWPAWQLYAPRNSRAVLSILEDRMEELPDAFLPYVSSPGGDFGIWRQIDLGAWSLNALHVPIYPHARFQIGVALATIEKHDLQSIRIDLQDTAERTTGKREQKVVSQISKLRQIASERFRLNALPRDSFSKPE